VAGAITQTTAAKLLSELWSNQPEYAVNNTRGFTKSIWDTGETYFGPGFKVHIPIVGAIAAEAYTGASVTYNNNVETEITATPTVAEAAVKLQEDVLLTTAYDAVRTYTPALAEGLYQKPDIDGLGLYAGFTSNDSTDAGDFTAATFQGLVSKILSNGGDKVQLGQLDGWYHPLKWDAIMAIGDFINASVRGESNSSAKTGNLGQAFGVNFNFTKNVATSTTLRNLIVSKKSMVLVRKNRPKIEMERVLDTLSTTVVASMMYAIVVLHQATGGMHRITTTT
jgi:hypothetical protein